MEWHKIAESELELDFGSNQVAVARAGEKTICIGRYQERLFAFAYTCPHASGLLADGYIDVLGNIVCPTHRYKFNVQNGRNTSGEGFYLRHWPLEIRENGVYVFL
jgi:3-phenylpropionate/trans-cinnamate dioxygenase ferredoxin subunit